MAPSFTSRLSKGSTPHRPVGDVGLADPVISLGSDMHFPAGDLGLIDDCSVNDSGFAISRIDSMNSIDQEESVPQILHSGSLAYSGRPVGVTAPRPLYSERRWDVNFTHQREDDYLLFAPLPHPSDSVEDGIESPRGSPSGAFVGGNYYGMSPYCFKDHSYEDMGAPGPAPTSPWSPGLELSPSNSRRQERVRRIAPNMVEDDIGHLDMYWADRREAAPLVLPVPLEREPSTSSREKSSPSSGTSSYGFQLPLPYPTDLETDTSAPSGSAPVWAPAPVTERPPDRFRQDLIFDSPQRKAPQRPPISSARNSGRKLQKQVSFSNLQAAEYGVVPYSEVYGEHPKNFNFDSNGNMVTNASLIQQWGFQAFQAHMFGNDNYSRRNHIDDHSGYVESEPLF